MSYYGTILMTRASVVMSRLPGIETIGYRHRRLRELGDGWQVLETSGWDDPPDLDRAAGEAAGWWKAPVFAVHVSDSCAQVHGAAAGTGTWSGHLPDPGDVACGFRHQPRVRAGATLAGLQAQILDWAGAAGLAVSAARLGRALRYRYAWQDVSSGPYLDQVEQIFELIRAFGFAVIPGPRAYEFDPTDEPFVGVTTAMWGLASQARSAAAYRADGTRSDPPAEWEAEAIALEVDVHAALYGGGHPVPELAARAEWVRRAYEAAREKEPAAPREITVGGRSVANVRRIVHDLGPRMVADHAAVARSPGGSRPNGTVFGDPSAGPGIWPDPS